jgi:hypothetical protein
MSSAGQPVDTAPPSTAKRESDLDRFFDYFTDRFLAEREQLVELLSACAAMRHKSDLVQLGSRALRFGAQLDLWVANGAMLLAELRVDEVNASYDKSQERAAEHGSARAPAEVLKAEIASRMAKIESLLAAVKNTRERMDKIARWAEAQQRTILNEEYGEQFLAQAEKPDELFDPSFDETLTAARR